MKFHHVGIVINNIADNVKIIENILQSKKTSIPFHDKIQKVNVTFLDLGNFYIELIEPNQTETPVTNFLEKHGSGIHHLGFEVEDIEKETNELRKKGGVVVCKPVLGYENRLVSFIFLESLPFKLIELFSNPQHNSNI
jgi:methylmalonyl-CoA/ethylmalonyl-CoA epimerase